MGETRVTVLVDELDLHTVYVEHPSERGTLILAESTNPDYTRGLTWYAHQEVKKLRNEMTKADLRRLGQYAYMLAWWKLLEKIQTDSTLAKRQIAKLTNGKGRSQVASAGLSQQQAPSHLNRIVPVGTVSIPTTVPAAPPAPLSNHAPKPDLPAADAITCSYAIITLE